MHLIASTVSISIPANTQLSGDYHTYTYPDQFVSNFNLFDQNATAGAKTLIGEYACTLANPGSGPAMPSPFWQGSVAEAVFLLGAERNAGSTLGASYAPSLTNTASQQWTPDLISFTSDTSQTVRSTSWHTISLLSNTRFTETRSVTVSEGDGFGPAYFVAGQNTDTGAYVLKAAVYNTTAPVPFSVTFAGVSAGTIANLTVLTAPHAYSMASIGVDPVVYSTKTLTAAVGGLYEFELPNLSLAVLLTSTAGEEEALKARVWGQFPGVGGYGGCKGGQVKYGNWNGGFGVGNGC